MGDWEEEMDARTLRIGIGTRAWILDLPVNKAILKAGISIISSTVLHYVFPDTSFKPVLGVSYFYPK